MTVSLVIVSHSLELARGVRELAGQMAPEVGVVAVGGTADGELGTDFEGVLGAANDASGDGAVLLYDLGSARMVAEMALEAADDPDRLRLADAPLVEGAVAAAVSAQGGAGLDTVAQAARGASTAGTSEPGNGAPEADPEAYRDEIVLSNEIGLHARPAAMLTRALQGLDARVTVWHGTREADASSVLALMSLGARKDDTIQVLASGTDGAEAVSRIRRLADEGFPG